MDRLRAMQVFLRVAERGSLTAASADLGYARGAASAIVKELEARLGVQLLERTTRKLRLTEDGRHYAERARAILADVDLLEADVGRAERTPRGLLRVQIPPGLARRIVAPALARFADRYPEVTLQILSRNAVPDFVTDRLDAALFVGDLPDSTLVARSLGRIPALTVAAPAYLARAGAPLHPADLVRHRAITILSSATGQPVPWHFRRGADTVTLTPEGPVAFEGSDAAVTAAVAGVGLVQLGSYLVYDDVKAGRLVPVLSDWRAPPAEARLLHPPHRLKPMKLKVFEDFLVDLNHRFRKRWNITVPE
jgi:LysR family transcriptional regulator for bpeEF and oprC